MVMDEHIYEEQLNAAVEIFRVFTSKIVSTDLQ